MSEPPSNAALPRRAVLGAILVWTVAACSAKAAKTTGATTSKTTSNATDPSASAARSTASATPSAPTTSAPPVVRGSNRDVTHAVLASDAASYDGRWTATWTEAGTKRTGAITGRVTIDPNTRVFTGIIDAVSGLLAGPALPATTVNVSVDSYRYDANTGTFAVHAHTGLGDATVTSDRGIGTGTFRLRLENIPGHPDVAHVQATGVAFRPDEIPVNYTVTFTDGRAVSGQMSIKPRGR